MKRRFLNALRVMFGRPTVPEPQNCSREQPHDGPCNGWPCKDALRKMGADNVIKFPSNGSWIAVKAPKPGTRCERRTVRVGFDNWEVEV